jgi:hypothetical protein
MSGGTVIIDFLASPRTKQWKKILGVTRRERGEAQALSSTRRRGSDRCCLFFRCRNLVDTEAQGPLDPFACRALRLSASPSSR